MIKAVPSQVLQSCLLLDSQVTDNEKVFFQKKKNKKKKDLIKKKKKKKKKNKDKSLFIVQVSYIKA